jgi:hypothetical protein
VTPSRIRVAAVAAALLTVAPAAAPAQESPLVLEVYGGVAAPVASFGDGTGPGQGATAGPSLSVLFALPGAGRRGLYAGFSQHRFGCEDAGCAADGRLVATGFDVGLRFALVRGRTFVPWLRLGAITTRVETDDLGAANAGVSDLGFGGEIGAGLYVGAASTLAINPGIRYAMVRTGLPGGSTLDMRYLMAQIALALAF